MSYLLDTNVCIDYLNARSVRVCQHLESLPTSQMAVCSIVKGELLVGAFKSRRAQAALARIEEFLAPYLSLPFDDACAIVYAKLRADLERHGRVIGAYDLLIAATALAHDATLVTHNVDEFSRVPGLRIEDWESE